MKNLVGNWEFTPIYTRESPEYFTVQSNLDSNLNGDKAGDRVMVNPSGTAHTGSDIYGLDRNGTVILPTASSSQTSRVVAWVARNPNARYIRAGYGTLPNAGRNTEASRPINNVDMSLIKRFAINERLKLELSGQAINLFNHPQFTLGFLNSISTVQTAYTPGVLNYVTASSSTFNDAAATFSSNPRYIIVTAKFSF